jgi:hypothetical protein
MRKTILILAAVSLVGCAQQPKQVFIRTDGQSIKGNAALEHQYQIDATVCEGDMQKANMSGTQFCRGAVDCAVAGAVRGEQAMTVGKGCMAQRGYMAVLETEADAKKEEFRGIARQQQQPPPQQTARR